MNTIKKVLLVTSLIGSALAYGAESSNTLVCVHENPNYAGSNEAFEITGYIANAILIRLDFATTHSIDYGRRVTPLEVNDLSICGVRNFSFNDDPQDLESRSMEINRRLETGATGIKYFNAGLETRAKNGNVSNEKMLCVQGTLSEFYSENFPGAAYTGLFYVPRKILGQ